MFIESIKATIDQLGYSWEFLEGGMVGKFLKMFCGCSCMYFKTKLGIVVIKEWFGAKVCSCGTKGR